MKYSIIETNKFKNSLKRCAKRGYNKNLLKEVINMLAKGEQLPAKYNDHKLHGKYKNCRECHIEPDWLLVYKIEDDKLILTLTNTGTHSDLF
ncbi:MAG: type II toxin-antitoxin system YafQ family toxin [Bacteroidetes bacterium]|nr:type II toxin-antitoxin system YafQ family toxin [Bacteroidota bacterium]